MDSTKILAAALVVLLAAGGVAAAGTGVGTQAATGDTGSVTNVDASATYDNGTVTVTVTDAGEPLPNVSVYADEEQVGETDANGTVTFETDANEELEIEFVGNGFEGELAYILQDGSLTLVEEEYEYERDDDEEEDERDDEYERDDDEADEDAEEEQETETEYESESEEDDEDPESDD